MFDSHRDDSSGDVRLRESVEVVEDGQTWPDAAEADDCRDGADGGDALRRSLRDCRRADCLDLPKLLRD